MSESCDLAVILGPRTRLARALLETAWARQRRLLLAARDTREGELLGSAYPSATILPMWQRSWSWPQQCDSVAVCCCALGIIHPESPTWSADIAKASRDIGLVEQVLQVYADVPVHVAVVSSVLALSPKRGREYYAGWKCVLEAAVAGMIRRHPEGRLSVLYPGRLVNRKSLARPASLLHTSYQRLAEALSRAVERPRPQRRVVGLDARTWLILRGMVAWREAISGSR